LELAGIEIQSVLNNLKTRRLSLFLRNS